MKISVILALGLGAGTAHAQTGVDIYGIVDAAIVGERGSYVSQPVKITSGAASSSRIGFRGSEDLGAGMSVLFTLESGTKIDSGMIDAAGTLFNREAWVGLKSGLGAVALGRQYTPWHLTLAAFDPFGTGYAGTSKNLFPDSGINIRTSNTITWKSP
ncbi:MAG: porin, partial [Duganella sp.]